MKRMHKTGMDAAYCETSCGMSGAAEQAAENWERRRRGENVLVAHAQALSVF